MNIKKDRKFSFYPSILSRIIIIVISIISDYVINDHNAKGITYLVIYRLY